MPMDTGQTALEYYGFALTILDVAWANFAPMVTHVRTQGLLYVVASLRAGVVVWLRRQ